MCKLFSHFVGVISLTVSPNNIIKNTFFSLTDTNYFFPWRKINIQRSLQKEDLKKKLIYRENFEKS